ncbi:hypothetical protein [uncultured Roseobacter sp.]|uniref:hypothetical protein n=1 Tax=uncultured Roseobacter sp. TaxID=114847 RepID=UPI00260F9225|nr:hypothetical protein [uncultured Roseobacter sp.]
MNKIEILKKLNVLQSSLSLSGKEDSAGFFLDLSDRIEKGADYPGALHEIISCGAISQYADFDTEQTCYLESLIELAEKELAVF